MLWRVRLASLGMGHFVVLFDLEGVWGNLLFRCPPDGRSPAGVLSLFFSLP